MCVPQSHKSDLHCVLRAPQPVLRLASTRVARLDWGVQQFKSYVLWRRVPPPHSIDIQSLALVKQSGGGASQWVDP